MADRSVVLLLSSGRHPVTGRVRAADHDARALRLALALAQRGCSLTALHAGAPDDAALGEYLGMGLPAITVLGPLGAAGDAVPMLVEAVSRRAPSLVLCGQAAETGEGSGMVPYLVAAALGLPVIADVSDVRLAPPGFKVLRAEPGGRRRQYSVGAQAVLAVGAFSAPAPSFAYGRMRRGLVHQEPMAAVADAERAGWTLRAARARPMRLDAAGADAGRDENRTLTGLTPPQAAERIMDFLSQIKVLKESAPQGAEHSQREHTA